MPDLSKGTVLTTPTSGTVDSYALDDYDLASYVNDSGVVSKRTKLFEKIYGEDNTNDLMAVQGKPVSDSNYSPLDHTNFGAAAGTGVSIKGSAGNVYSVFVTSGTSAVRYFQLFNQSTVPVNGQTPVASYPLGSVVAGNFATLQLDSTHFAPSKYFSAGIAAAISSTNGTLGTASITITDYTWHIKYM